MRDKNLIQILGNLADDVTIRTGAKGEFATFRVAASEKWKDNGETKERTEFISVISFNEHVVKRLADAKKGTRVYVEAKIRNRKDDAGAYHLDIVTDDVEIIAKPVAA
jgi:single-strand DNA-binding protein